MSRENVELVKRAYEAFNTGGVDAILEYMDPEIVWEDLDALPDAGKYRGHEAFRESVRQFYDAFGELSFTGEEFIDAGDDVVVAHRWHGSGRSSGTPFEGLVWNVMTVRDGKLVRRRGFTERKAALAAVGLAEDSATGETRD